MIACTDLVEHSVVWLDRIATNALDGIATNGIREYYFNYVLNGSYAHRDACRTATTASSTAPARLYVPVWPLFHVHVQALGG